MGTSVWEMVRALAAVISAITGLMKVIWPNGIRR